MTALLDSSRGCERLDIFAVPFVMGAAGDVSEGEVDEDFRFCSSLLLLTQSFTFTELPEAKLSKASLVCPNVQWWFCGMRGDRG